MKQGDGAEDLGLGEAESVTLVAEGHGDPICLGVGVFGVGMGVSEPGEPGEGGIAILEAVSGLLAVEAVIVVGGDGADGVVLGVEGLDDDPPATRAPAGPTSHLGQHLEDSLSGAIVGEVDADVGAHYAHEGDLGKVEALGDHLGADQDVDLAGLELAKDLFVPTLVGGGVPVPAEGASPGESGAHLLLDALSACADVAEVGAAALAAHLGPVDAVSAVMAEEATPGAVVDEGYLAAAALDYLAAVAAVDGGGEAPPIDEEDDLFAGLRGPWSSRCGGGG